MKIGVEEGTDASYFVPRFESLNENGIVGFEEQNSGGLTNIRNESLGLFVVQRETINQKALKVTGFQFCTTAAVGNPLASS